MCGIVGYVGPGSSVKVLLGGLKRLEYRGYDSAGVAVLDDAGVLSTRKRAGKLGILVDDLEAYERDLPLLAVGRPVRAAGLPHRRPRHHAPSPAFIPASKKHLKLR